MSMVSPAAARSAVTGWPTELARTIGRWAQRIVSYWHHRAAIKALQELDDRALRDIGLTRPFIAAAVKGEIDPELGRLR